MNLKHFYYRTYFEAGIKLSQPEKKSDARDANEKHNEQQFKQYNKTLTASDITTPFQMPRELAVETLYLEVLNPGLLPGVGYPHEVGYAGEFKLGFSFDHTTGLPVLPGSSVKGVVRSVFPQLIPGSDKQPDERQQQKARFVFRLLSSDGKNAVEGLDPAWDDTQKLAFVTALEQSMFCGKKVKGFNTPEMEYELEPMTKHDCFLDALPVKFNTLLGRDALTPHGRNVLENPTPLPFAKVMPGVVFGFYFRLNEITINDITITAKHKKELISKILCTIGAGAKTNVGYGQFEKTKQEIKSTPKVTTASVNILESEYYGKPLPANQKGLKIKGRVIGPDPKKEGKTKVNLLIIKGGEDVNRSILINPEPAKDEIINIIINTNGKGEIDQISHDK